MVLQVTIKQPKTMAYGITLKKKDKEKIPEYYCKTCGSCQHKYCDVFKRHVEPDYNKCFNHTNYPSRCDNFKTPENLDEIIKKEEAIKCYV